MVRAYEAKIEKESNGKAFIYTADCMLSAHAAMADNVQALEQQLGTHDGDWVMGDDYTLADIMWTASLFRLKWLGLGHLWEGNASAPRVRGYLPPRGATRLLPAGSGSLAHGLRSFKTRQGNGRPDQYAQVRLGNDAYEPLTGLHPSPTRKQ